MSSSPPSSSGDEEKNNNNNLIQADFHTITSDWSDNLEKVVKNIGESCRGYKWMNMYASRVTSWRHSVLMWLTIIFGPISGVLTAISFETYSDIVDIFIILFSFLTGIMSGIVKYSKYEQRSASHRAISAKYASLESSITNQLSLNKKDRVNAGKYLEWVSMSFEELFSSSPIVSEDIYNAWVNIAKKEGLTIPRELDENIITNDARENANMKTIETITAPDTIPTATQPGTNTNMSASSVAGIQIVVQTDPKEGPNNTTGSYRKRKDVDVSIPDLNRYRDGRMRYEMARFFNLK